MATKTTGAEFKRFYNDDKFWPRDSDVWHDDEEIKVDGVTMSGEFDMMAVADGAKMEISGGIVYCVRGEPSFEAYFKKWKKGQTTVSILVECDASNLDVVRAAIRAAGGKVVV